MSVRGACEVLVVGGGPVGLTASLLLSEQQIEHVVVERRTETQHAPAAHVLRPRPMSVFDRLGVANDIRRASPALALDFITFCSTLGGAEAGRLDLRAGLPPGADVWTHCPQNLLEPVLLDRAVRSSRAEIVRGAECIDVEQDGRGVRARVRTPDGSEATIEAKWLLATDGASSATRRRLEIPMVGPGPQGRFFMVHFEADLRPWIERRSGPLFWLLNPSSPGTLIVHDPAKSHVFMTLQRGTDGEREELPGRVERALGVPAGIRILSVDSWSPHVQVAERYRRGGAFLAGDAAHRFPPTGGLGLNTGILDVEVWVHLLARVRSGEPADCLDRYEAICRPVAEENATESFANLKRLGEIHAVLGPCADLAALEARLASLSPEERDQLARAIERQRSHFVSEGRLPPEPPTLAA